MHSFLSDFLPGLLPYMAQIQMWVTFAIISGAIVLFANDRIPIELSSMAVVAVLLVFFNFFPVMGPDGTNQLDAPSLLKGFANPVVFAIMALLVVGQGLYNTGALEGPANLIARLGRVGPWLAFGVAFIIAGIVSAFMNNTPVVVIFIPIITAVSANMGMNPSRSLMPLSFICILGGMTTLIGSSANLIAATIAEQSGVGKIGFFDFSIPGLFLASIGAVYVIFILPRLMGKNSDDANDENIAEGGKQFIAQIPLSYGHPWIGFESAAGFFPDLKNITIRMVRRGNKVFVPPFDDVSLSDGDIVVLAATRKILSDALQLSAASSSAKAEEVEEPNDTNPDRRAPRRKSLSIAEAVVAPASRLIGANVDPEIIHAETGIDFVGIQRRSRMGRGAISDIRLEAGDVILLLGEHRQIKKLRNNRNLLLLDWLTEELPRAHHALHALVIFGITIWLAATGMMPIAISAMMGAVAMIATGCLNVRQALRAIDGRVFLLVGTAFALAAPLQLTGGAQFVAEGVVHSFSGYGPAVLLSAFFLLTAILTNFLSNAATAALMAPIVVSAAREIGADPMPFVYGLIFALNCSFATPIAYQTNLIVMGPGNYSFKDFIRGGLPLIFLIWIAYSLFAPFYFDL